MKALFGGSDSSGQQSSRNGFALLPPELQQAWKQYGTQVTGQFASPQAGAFTPMPQTAGETSAISAINKGFTPDQTQLNTINREAAGQGSVLNSALSRAGQFGSNRASLGANDIDLTRLNQIGSFKNQEFQQAMQNALTTLPQLRAQSAQAQLSGGAVEAAKTKAELDLQTKQAPISALQAFGQLVGVLPQSGGGESQGSSKSNTQNGMFAPIAL